MKLCADMSRLDVQFFFFLIKRLSRSAAFLGNRETQSDLISDSQIKVQCAADELRVQLLGASVVPTVTVGFCISQTRQAMHSEAALGLRGA